VTEGAEKKAAQRGAKTVGGGHGVAR